MPDLTSTITDMRHMAEDYFLLLCDVVKFRIKFTIFWGKPNDSTFIVDHVEKCYLQHEGRPTYKDLIMKKADSTETSIKFYNTTGIIS